MQEHTKIYLREFGYSVGCFIPSELSEAKGQVIHHIHRRGMGGDPEMDRVENLMCLTDAEHEEYGDKVEFKAMLYRIHKARMIAAGVKFDREWIDAQIEKYSLHEIIY